MMVCWLGFIGSEKYYGKVLILILVDDGLLEPNQRLLLARLFVLILILVDDGLLE